MTDADIDIDCESEDACPIYYSLLYQPVRTDCGHLFCYFCFAIRWTAEKKNCSLCREEFCRSTVVSIDREAEANLINRHGMEAYNLRRDQVIQEKIDRLMAATKERPSDFSSIYDTLDHSVHAGLIGSVMGVPAGVCAALVTALGVSGFQVFQSIRFRESHRYGLIEDQGNGNPREILFHNKTLVPAEVRSFSALSPFPFETLELPPNAEVSLKVPGDPEPPLPYLETEDPCAPFLDLLDRTLKESWYSAQLVRPSALINGELARIEEVGFDGSYILCSLVLTQRLVDPKNGKSGISSRARKIGESLKESSSDWVVNINIKLVKRKRMIGFQNKGNELVILIFFRPEDTLTLWPLSSCILKPKEVCYWNPDPENPREPEYLCQLTRPSQDSEDPLESVVLKREASFQVYDHQ